MCLIEDKPTVSCDDCSFGSKEKLKKCSNRLSMMIIRRSFHVTICNAVPSCETTKEFLDEIAKNSKESDDAELGIF